MYRKLLLTFVTLVLTACAQATPIQSVSATREPLPKFEFVHQRGVSLQLGNTEGKVFQHLNIPNCEASEPKVSPTGQSLTFTAACGKKFYDVYTMNFDGSSLTRLTDKGDNYFPDWSPDGRKIVFGSLQKNYMDIYTMNADGTEVTLLSGSPDHSDSMPAWSPDGKWIAFAKHTKGYSRIFMIRPDGTELHEWSNGSGEAYEGFPAWSPDGTKLAFTSNRDGEFDIYVANLDGSGTIRLTNDQARDIAPAWSSDASRIAYTSNSGSGWDVHIITLSDRTSVQVTHYDQETYALVDWLP